MTSSYVGLVFLVCYTSSLGQMGSEKPFWSQHPWVLWHWKACSWLGTGVWWPETGLLSRFLLRFDLWELRGPTLQCLPSGLTPPTPSWRGFRMSLGYNKCTAPKLEKSGLHIHTHTHTHTHGAHRPELLPGSLLETQSFHSKHWLWNWRTVKWPHIPVWPGLSQSTHLSQCCH